MKLLIIGGSGLVGGHLLAAAQKAGEETTGTYRRHPGPGLELLDTADIAAAKRLIDRCQPEAVIHAAGWTWVDGCEEDPLRAEAENAREPGELARWCHRLGIHFTYFSTSYVFDGERGPYRESDHPNPINVYGESKWNGERAVLDATEGHALIPRVICVYGEEAQRKNFVYQVWRAMEEGREIILPSDQRGNPTYAGDVAQWTLDLVRQRVKGIRHLPGPWPHCTRVAWAEQIVACLEERGIGRRKGFDLRSVKTDQMESKALRPLLAGLLTGQMLKPDPTPFNDTIRKMLR